MQVYYIYMSRDISQRFTNWHCGELIGSTLSNLHILPVNLQRTSCTCFNVIHKKLTINELCVWNSKNKTHNENR